MNQSGKLKEKNEQSEDRLIYFSGFCLGLVAYHMVMGCAGYVIIKDETDSQFFGGIITLAIFVAISGLGLLSSRKQVHRRRATF